MKTKTTQQIDGRDGTAFVSAHWDGEAIIKLQVGPGYAYFTVAQALELAKVLTDLAAPLGDKGGR